MLFDLIGNGFFDIKKLVLVSLKTREQVSDEGQNPIEPILAGKPVITGPEMKNFAALAERLVAAGGILMISDASKLPSALEDLLRDPAKAAAIVEAGRRVVAEDQGAADRTVTALEPLLAVQ